MDTSTRQDWGNRLRERRGNISQAHLAEVAGTAQSIISRIELGQIAPSDEMKWKLAGALGCTVADLFPWPAVRPPFPSVGQAAS